MRITSYVIGFLSIVLFAWISTNTVQRHNTHPSIGDTIQNNRELISSYSKRISSCLSQDAHDDEITFREFSRIVVGVYDEDDQSVHIWENDFAPLQERSTLQFLPVILYRSDGNLAKRLHGEFVYYGHSSNIFLPSIPMSDPWFCAFFKHEYFHAYRHRTRGGENFDSRSPQLLDEEVQAHELTRAVLDTYTEGTYREQILKLLQSSDKSLSGLQDAIAMHGAPARISNIFPNAKSPNEERMRRAQYLTDLTFIHIKTTGGGVEEKRHAYRELVHRFR